MKGTLMSVSDRLLLRKRAIIETMNDELKNIVQVEHYRHRCFDNFIVNLLGAIAAYCLFPKKPCINVQRTVDTQFSMFWLRRTHVKIQSNIRTFLWRVFECIGQQVNKQLVNLSTHKFVTQKNFIHLLICLSITLSFLAKTVTYTPKM